MQSASKTVICIIKPILLIKTFFFPIKCAFYKIDHGNNLIISTYYHQKLYHSYILVNDSTIETPVSFAVEQLKTIGVCKTKQ